MTEELLAGLEKAGFRGRVVPVERLPQLKAEIDGLLGKGLLDQRFHGERLTFYETEPPEGMATARSMIITAAPQPKVRVRFNLKGRVYPAIIPPTYSLATDSEVLAVIEPILKQGGYRLTRALLPAKALAGHSGLIAYGRNNITYADKWGSFFRLKAFYSDLPVSRDPWQDFEVLDRCDDCGACVNVCPTGAIDPDRFLLRADRCLTYLNEGEADFPEWLDPSWHNCLVGCMICQEACPVNRKHIDWTVDGTEFDEDETALILGGPAGEDIPEPMIEKLKSVDLWWGECQTLGRNLRMLVDRAAGQ
jgi:epoxyqueuosine reductase